MLIEVGNTPLIAVATAPPGAGYPKISRNGASFVATAMAATNLGEGFWAVRLTVQETSQEGTVVVVFGSGVGTVVQIRNLVSEITRDVGGVVQNSTQTISKQITSSGTDQTAAVQNLISTQVSTALAKMAPRHGETGLK